VGRGETVAVLGRSGTGKSVLLKLIVGLDQPDSGSIRIQDQEIKDLDDGQLNEVRKKIGFLFQQAALYDSLTVGENVAFPLNRHSKMSDAERKSRVGELLSSVGMEHDLQKMPSEISGGMKKRVGLARALALEPEILLFDEPTAGLDPISSRLLDELILELRDSLGSTIVVVTHELPSIFTIGNNSIFLDVDSRTMTASGDPKELRDRSDNPNVRRFLTRGAEGAEAPPHG
jgi:phospholipid/cholesterol/gamma-HCH transport system ATP-binding protein